MSQSMTANGLQLKEVGGFLPRCFCGEKFFFYHKALCGANCHQFPLGAVMVRAIEAQSFECQLCFLVGQLCEQNKVRFLPKLLGSNNHSAV